MQFLKKLHFTNYTILTEWHSQKFWIIIVVRMEWIITILQTNAWDRNKMTKTKTEETCKLTYKILSVSNIVTWQWQWQWHLAGFHLPSTSLYVLSSMLAQFTTRYLRPPSSIQIKSDQILVIFLNLIVTRGFLVLT